MPPSDEAIENGDIEEDELAELEEKLEVDYQIGEDLKEKVWYPLSEFNPPLTVLPDHSSCH